MHKGRKIPRQHPFYLSCGAKPPWFAPQFVKPNGLVGYVIGLTPIPDVDWTAAVVDEPNLRMGWAGTLDMGLFEWYWLLKQTYNADRGANDLECKLYDGLGSEIRWLTELPVGHLEYNGDALVSTAYPSTTYVGSFFQWTAPRFLFKQWR